MAHIVATGAVNRPGPNRLPPWSDQFLLIQPSSLGFRNPNRSNEIQVVHENNGRVFSNILHPDIRKFSELFDLAQEDKINILANGDIFFDDTSQLEKIFHIPYNVCYALSRWELPEGGKPGEGKLFDRADSQDVWIFRGRLNLLPGFGSYNMGILGCDNRLAWELDHNGYGVLNPSKTIKTWHYHNSKYRTYREQPLVPPPYLYISPTELMNDDD